MHTEIVDTAKTGVRQAHWESDGAGSRSTGVSTQEVLATVTARSDPGTDAAQRAQKWLSGPLGPQW